jgi:two-component system sensor histidine kinase QseC
MTPSIRTFLLINLLLSVTLIISLAIIGNLYMSHRDIQEHLDADLLRSNLRLQALFNDFTPSKINPEAMIRLQSIQKRLLQYSHHIKQNKVGHTNIPKDILNGMQFQIWGKNGQLILHSESAPDVPLSNGNSGFSTTWISHKVWRTNTIYNPNSGMIFMTGEHLSHRQNLENRLTRDSIIVMLITYPFLGLLIWVIVGRGLNPLKSVAREVRNRAPNYLEPVDIKSTPSEIAPLMEALNHLFQRLQDAFEREKRFTADAAHELKTPLAALSTHTQIALRAKDSEDRKESLLKVLAGVNRSTHMIQQLLTLSRMDPEANLQSTEPVNLTKEATDIAAHLAPEAIAKNIELELESCNEETEIQGNPTAINILIRNLVDNAIRYSPENSLVTIKIQKTRQFTILRVIDNGPGIPEQLKRRVFERFFRVMGTQAAGSGLGLGIVQKIAKLHGAVIKLVTPKGGQGLDFQVKFPNKH